MRAKAERRSVYCSRVICAWWLACFRYIRKESVPARHAPPRSSRSSPCFTSIRAEAGAAPASDRAGTRPAHTSRQEAAKDAGAVWSLPPELHLAVADHLVAAADDSVVDAEATQDLRHLREVAKLVGQVADLQAAAE